VSLEIPEKIASWKHNKSVNHNTMRQIITIMPNIVVDVGVGDGYYGTLIKYFLPDVHLVGVEIMADYITSFNLNSIYNEIVNKDIFDCIQEFSGDLIIFGDVLEHIEKEKGIEILKCAVNKFNFVIINGPIGFQKHEHEISSEIHRSGWSVDDFGEYVILEYVTYCNNALFNCLLLGKQKSDRLAHK